MSIDRFIRMRDVVKMTGRSASSIQRDIQAGRFPHPSKIGPRSIGWLESQVVAWIERTANTDSNVW